MPMNPALWRMKQEDGGLLPVWRTTDYLKSTTIKAKDALGLPQLYESYLFVMDV